MLETAIMAMTIIIIITTTNAMIIRSSMLYLYGLGVDMGSVGFNCWVVWVRVFPWPCGGVVNA